ncbi:hypothetical protein TNCV_1730511 [Trichonephila clavipes]|nr:hypothetical protein TNCV_1730511 [Trichonephila clavipes]
MDDYEETGTMRVDHAFQRATVSNTFCSMHGRKCIGYCSKKYEYHVESGNYSCPVINAREHKPTALVSKDDVFFTMSGQPFCDLDRGEADHWLIDRHWFLKP